MQDYLPHYFTDSELDDMYEIIDDYPTGHRNKLPYIKAEFLFPRKDQTEHLDKYDIENRFPCLRKWAGIKANRTRKFERNICLHCFRHCFAIKSFKKLEANGVHLDDAVPYLSIYLGHNKLKETEKYLSFSAEMYPDELECFDNIMETNLPDDAMWNDVYGEVPE